MKNFIKRILYALVGKPLPTDLVYPPIVVMGGGGPRQPGK